MFYWATLWLWLEWFLNLKKNHSFHEIICTSSRSALIPSISSGLHNTNKSIKIVTLNRVIRKSHLVWNLSFRVTRTTSQASVSSVVSMATAAVRSSLSVLKIRGTVWLNPCTAYRTHHRICCMLNYTSSLSLPRPLCVQDTAVCTYRVWFIQKCYMNMYGCPRADY